MRNSEFLSKLRFRSNLLDPAGAGENLDSKGKRKSVKRSPKSPNWDDDQIQKRANDLLPKVNPEPGPNAGNIHDKNERRAEKDYTDY